MKNKSLSNEATNKRHSSLNACCAMRRVTTSTTKTTNNSLDNHHVSIADTNSDDRACFLNMMRHLEFVLNADTGSNISSSNTGSITSCSSCQCLPVDDDMNLMRSIAEDELNDGMRKSSYRL